MVNRRPAPTREERLAAKLRENLHRRKAQGRAHDRIEESGKDAGEHPPVPAPTRGLPKAPPNS